MGIGHCSLAVAYTYSVNSASHHLWSGREVSVSVYVLGLTLCLPQHGSFPEKDEEIQLGQGHWTCHDGASCHLRFSLQMGPKLPRLACQKLDLDHSRTSAERQQAQRLFPCCKGKSSHEGSPGQVLDIELQPACFGQKTSCSGAINPVWSTAISWGAFIVCILLLLVW